MQQGIAPLTENKSTRLTPTAAALFPDLAGRPGELLRVEGGWAVVRFGEVVVRVKQECVENVEQKIGDQSAVSGLLGERGESRRATVAVRARQKSMDG